MTQKTQPAIRLYWIHALTPLHVGSGRGVGYIDLPIMREKVTNWPLVPGSAFKGVLADHHGVTDNTRDPSKKEVYSPWHRAGFGRAGDEASNSGSLVFTDTRLVCLPVRSLYGTFAWCTSPMVLRRLRRDLKWAGMEGDLVDPAEVPPDQARLVHDDGLTSVLSTEGKAFFEDLDFQRADDSDSAWSSKLAKWVFQDEPEWREEFRKRFAILPDDAFNFLCDTATQVDARVRIEDETKTVVGGALWYEEALPAETILAGLVWCDRIFLPEDEKELPNNEEVTQEGLLKQFCKPAMLQIGGKATVGRGQVRAVFTGPGSE